MWERGGRGRGQWGPLGHAPFPPQGSWRVERVGEEAAEENMLVAQIHPTVEKERSGVKRLAKPQLLHDLWQLSNRLGWWRAFWWA